MVRVDGWTPAQVVHVDVPESSRHELHAEYQK